MLALIIFEFQSHLDWRKLGKITLIFLDCSFLTRTNSKSLKWLKASCVIWPCFISQSSQLHSSSRRFSVSRMHHAFSHLKVCTGGFLCLQHRSSASLSGPYLPLTFPEGAFHGSRSTWSPSVLSLLLWSECLSPPSPPPTFTS